MNQIIKIFSISAEKNKSDEPITPQLVEKINIFAKEKKYKIVTISHHLHWYIKYASWEGHAIVVFEPIENPNNSTNQTANLLDFNQ